MKDRIKKVRKKLDLTQQEFADKLGLKQNTIATYEIGRTNPSDQAIISICREFDVNESWLRTGEGEMFEQLSDKEKLMKATAHILKGSDSAVISAIQTLIITYDQLDDTSKAVLEKIALQYIDNLKKSQ